MSRLNDQFVYESDDFGEPTLQGVSEGADSIFSQIFGLAQRTATIVRDFSGNDPVETNARAARPAISPEPIPYNWLLIGGALLAILLGVLVLKRR